MIPPRVLMLALLVLLALAGWSLKGKAGSAPPASISPADLERGILAGVNEIRQQNGLPSLTESLPLSTVARAYSERMGREGFRGHFDPQGKGPAERVTAAGIAYQGVAENVARSTPYQGRALSVLLDGWMASPGHRANILESGFTQTGVGVWWDGGRYYCTQLFLRPR